jgi:hypothetical protein
LNYMKKPMKLLFATLGLVIVSLALPRARSRAATPTPPFQPEIVYFSSGRLTLGGELYRPTGRGPFPAVLYNHGSAEGMLSDAASSAMGPRYAARGWIYPPFGTTAFDGHSFTWLGSAIWFDDVFSFIQDNCPPRT